MFIRGSLILYQLILKLAFNEFINCFDPTIFVLVCLMLIDVIIGVLGAIARKSNKSTSGRFEKGAMLLGISRKLVVVFLIWTAVLLDILLDTIYIRKAISYLFCARELKSIIKNAEVLGVQCSSFFKSIVIALENISGKHTDTYFKDNKK